MNESKRKILKNIARTGEDTKEGGEMSWAAPLIWGSRAAASAVSPLAFSSSPFG